MNKEIASTDYGYTQNAVSITTHATISIYNVSFTFSTSCREDMLPNGLGDRGNDGGCSLGRCGAVRFAPGSLICLLMGHSVGF